MGGKIIPRQKEQQVQRFCGRNIASTIQDATDSDKTLAVLSSRCSHFNGEEMDKVIYDNLPRDKQERDSVE